MSSKTGNSANFCEIQWIQAQENWEFSQQTSGSNGMVEGFFLFLRRNNMFNIV